MSFSQKTRVLAARKFPKVLANCFELVYSIRIITKTKEIHYEKSNTIRINV